MYKKLNQIRENLIPTKLTTVMDNTIQYSKTQTISCNTIEHKHTL